MDAAWEAGIDWFDTADAYGGGRSERAIGRWMAARGVRPRLTTKTFNPMEAGADHGLKPERIARQLRSSLDRLGVDQVDLYLAHEFDPDVPLAETFGAFEHRPGRRPDRRVRGQQLRRAAARRRAGGRRAAGDAEQLLAAGPAGRAGPAAAVRRTRRRLPGVQPAGGRLAHRQVPARRAVPGRVADDPAARAVPGSGHRRRPSTRWTCCRRSPRAAAPRWPGSRSAGCSRDERVTQVVIGPGRPEHLAPVGRGAAAAAHRGGAGRDRGGRGGPGQGGWSR